MFTLLMMFYVWVYCRLYLGSCHLDLSQCNLIIKEQSTKLWHVSNYLFNKPALELSEMLAKKTFADKVFFTNSGAESVECAIKIARRFFFSTGQSSRNRIISFDGSFHGRTMGTISAAGSKKLLEGFGPKLPGFDLVKKLSLDHKSRIASKLIDHVISCD